MTASVTLASAGKATYRYPRRRVALSVFAAVAVIAAAVSPSVQSKAREQTAAQVANALGDKIFAAQFLNNASTTIVVSPLSLGRTVTSLGQYASGKTRRAFVAALALQKQGELTTAAQSSQALQQALTSQSNVQVTLAGSIWLDRSLRLARASRGARPAHGGAMVKRLDFAAPQATGEINRWVQTNTGGKITEIVDHLSADTAIVLVDALYFKGRWLDAFDAKKTKSENFTRADGAVVSVPMMHKSREFAYDEDQESQIVAVPFAGERIELRVVLPTVGTALPRKPGQFASWLRSRRERHLQNKPGRLGIPRLKLEWGGELLDTLKGIGFEEALGSRAEFRRLTPNRVAIGGVAHRVVLQLDEEGAEAGAATAVTMYRSLSTTPPFDMQVNRPFFVFVRDRVSGAVLLQAFVASPGQGT